MHTIKIPLKCFCLSACNNCKQADLTVWAINLEAICCGGCPHPLDIPLPRVQPSSPLLHTAVPPGHTCHMGSLAPPPYACRMGIQSPSFVKHAAHAAQCPSMPHAQHRQPGPSCCTAPSPVVGAGTKNWRREAEPETPVSTPTSNGQHGAQGGACKLSTGQSWSTTLRRELCAIIVISFKKTNFF